MTVMFNNAGMKFCYDRVTDEFYVLGAEGSEEIRCADAMQVWTYYIQRVDTAVRKRIRSMKPKQIRFEDY